MAAKKITQELVNEVADRQMAQGIKPSALSILKELGYGSLTTIQKYLNIWRETHSEQQASPVLELPPEVEQLGQRFVGDMWRHLSSSAAGMIKKVTDASIDAVSRAKSECDEYVKMLEVVQAELETEQQKHKAAQRKIRDLERKLHVMVGKEEKASELHERSQARVEELEADLASAMTRLGEPQSPVPAAEAMGEGSPQTIESHAPESPSA